MPASTASSAERRAARRVAWRERLLGGAALVFGKLRGDKLVEWDRGAPVLLYHRVYGGQVPSHDPFGVTRSAFELQVSWLAERFELCTVAELVRRFERGKGAEGPGPDGDGSRGVAAITFDDGYECTYREAWPVLRQAGIPATLFVDTARLDGPRPALTSEELSTMASEGLEIASHSASHVDTTTLDAGELAQEMETSRQVLESLLEGPVVGFAAPYGRYDAATIEAARAAGYLYLCTCRQHQTNHPRGDPFLVDRLEINRGDDIHRVERKLQGAYARVYEAWYRLNPATRHWVSD